MPRLEIPRPTRLAVARAFIVWASRGLWLFLLIFIDVLRGRRDEERTAAHAHRILTGMDPVAVKVARLFAYRYDLLSISMATMLADLDDSIPPLEPDVAASVVAESLGVPLDTIFKTFDRKAMGSRVLRCTYQAVLHDGTEVIVRLRPPGMRQRLVNQLAAVQRLLAILELFAIVRPGFFSYLKAENANLLMQEADFRHQARSHRLFGKRSRRDDLDFASESPLYEEWVRDNLLIAPKIQGLWLSDVLQVVEQGDPWRLAELNAQGIEPKKLARRVMQLAWWQQMEHLFFLAAPITADILVLPDSRLAILHFTTTAAATSRHRQLLRDLYQRVGAEDASGTAEVLMQFLTPMPFIDTHAFFKRLEARVWHQILAMHDKQAPWWERTSVGLWAALLSAAREEGIQVHLEVIQLMRSAMMFEDMAFRLNSGFDLVKEFRRYRRTADERTAHRLGKGLRRALGKDPRATLTARLYEASSLVQRIGFFVETQLENTPITNLAMPRKAAYAAMVVLQTLSVGIVAALAGGALTSVTEAATHGGHANFVQATMHVFQNPIYIGLISLVGLIGVRRLLFRLGDKD